MHWPKVIASHKVATLTSRFQASKVYEYHESAVKRALEIGARGGGRAGDGRPGVGWVSAAEPVGTMAAKVGVVFGSDSDGGGVDEGVRRAA